MEKKGQKKTGSIFTMRNLLFALIALVIISRIFTAIALPDTAFTDALYHLTISKELVITGSLPFSSSSNEIIFQHIQPELPPAFFHVAIAEPFILSGRGLDFYLAGFFPVLISILEICLIFLVCRLFFEKKPEYGLIAFLFASAQPVLSVFSSVNYPEAIATVLVLFSFYLLMKFNKTKNTAFLLPLPFSIAAAAVSKLTATVLLPVFLIAIIYYPIKHRVKHAKKIAVFLAVLAFLLSSFWFLGDFRRAGISHPEYNFFQKLFSSNASDVQNLADTSLGNFQKLALAGPAGTVLQFNESFWYFLPASAQSKVPFLQAVPIDAIRILFSAITIPLIAVCIYGLYLILRKREQYWLLLLGILLLGLVPFIQRFHGIIFARLLLVLLPFSGIFFARGLMQINNGGLKKILLLFFCLALLYSCFFMVSTAVYYNNAFSEVSPAFAFIKTLPENSKIAAQRHITRAIIFFTGRDSERDWDEYATANPEELYGYLAGLKEKESVTHLLATCTRSPWNKAALDALEAEGKLRLAFKENCSMVYEIK